MCLAATCRRKAQAFGREEMPIVMFGIAPTMRRRCAVLALVAGCLGAPADAAFVGPLENFEAQVVGNFPTGWSDVGVAEPDPGTPNPSAVVVNTTNAFGKATKALAPVP